MFRLTTAAALIVLAGAGNAAADAKPFGVLAAGIENVGQDAYVSVGSADGDTVDTAEQAAIQKCQENGLTCKAVYYFSNGDCGYIATGSGNFPNGQGKVGWGAGATESAAYDSCQSLGDISCTTGDIVGFCAGMLGDDNDVSGEFEDF